MHEVSLLIIAYQRPESLREILNTSKESFDQIFISVDAPKPNDIRGAILNDAIREVIDGFISSFHGDVKVFFREANVGCAVSVITSCDWFFSQVDFGIVLEDDCIPAKDFLKFTKSCIAILEDDKRVLLASGHQPIPKNVSRDSLILSKYAQVWGWATTSKKWKIVKNLILDEGVYEQKCPGSIRNLPTSKFFAAGARRSRAGFIDAWDLPLVSNMIRYGFLAILPPVNLISNVGGDDVATHTGSDKSWLYTPTESIRFPLSKPNFSSPVEFWLEKHYYNIRTRHVITTLYTRFLDVFSKPRFEPLCARVSKSGIVDSNY